MPKIPNIILASSITMIRMDLREIGWGVDLIRLAQDRDQ
jgi:hypothetical protein